MLLELRRQPPSGCKLPFQHAGKVSASTQSKNLWGWVLGGSCLAVVTLCPEPLRVQGGKVGKKPRSLGEVRPGGPKVPLKSIEYGFGYIVIRSPYNPYSIYLRGTKV